MSDMKNKILGFSTVSCYFLVIHSCNTLNSDINRTFHVTNDVASIEYHTKMEIHMQKKPKWKRSKQLALNCSFVGDGILAMHTTTTAKEKKKESPLADTK